MHQEDRLVDLLLEGSRGRHSMEVKWSLLQSHTTQSLLKSATLVFLEGAHCRFSLGAASQPLCRSKLSRVRPLDIRGTGQMSLPLGE